MTKSLLAPFFLSLFAFAFLAGCSSDDSGSSGDSGSTSGASVASLEDCTPETLATFREGVLTVATDSPAYPPYFEDDDPSNGKGFESAVAYAVADKLGFSRSEVEWTVVPFNASYAPGPKKFDFDVNQISITPAREKAVDFSIPYYNANQAVLVTKDSDIGEVSGFDELRKLDIGVQIGTTSLGAVESRIEPTKAPKVYKNSNDLVTALDKGRVDAVVLDLPTAIEIKREVAPATSIAAQFSAPGGDDWGALLAKDSSLTPCVNAALDSLRMDGSLEEITRQWMSAETGVPEIDPA